MKRHNLIRNEVFYFCAGAGLNPELERPGLLQPRPLLGALAEDGSRGDPHSRRPADVYLPRWRQGVPAALDFAVTSGLRDSVTSSEETRVFHQTEYVHKSKYHKSKTVAEHPSLIVLAGIGCCHQHA